MTGGVVSTLRLLRSTEWFEMGLRGSDAKSGHMLPIVFMRKTAHGDDGGAESVTMTSGKNLLSTASKASLPSSSNQTDAFSKTTSGTSASANPIPSTNIHSKSNPHLPTKKNTKLESFFGEKASFFEKVANVNSIDEVTDWNSTELQGPPLSAPVQSSHSSNPMSLSRSQPPFTSKTTTLTPPQSDPSMMPVGAAIMSRGKLRNFFGQRPPSEVVTTNLSKYFPKVHHNDSFTSKSSPHLTSLPLKNSLPVQESRQIPAQHSMKKSISIPASSAQFVTSSSSNNLLFSAVPGNIFKNSLTSKSSRSQSQVSLDVGELLDNKVENDPDGGIVDDPAVVATRHFVAPIQARTATPPFPLIAKSASALDISSSSAPSSLVLPSMGIKKWVKGALIGTGSYGSVYMALNAHSGELMAVKQVFLPGQSFPSTNECATGENATPNPSSPSNSDRDRKKATKRTMMVDALHREIALLRELQHPNIVRYLGSQYNDNALNIFLEYVPGGSLSSVLVTYGVLEETLMKTFIKQILAGLTYLHNKSIVHRDIKGGNILVDNRGMVKISDFGISKKMPVSLSGVSGHGGVVDSVLVSTNQRSSSLQGSVFWYVPTFSPSLRLRLLTNAAGDSHFVFLVNLDSRRVGWHRRWSNTTTTPKSPTYGVWAV